MMAADEEGMYGEYKARLRDGRDRRRSAVHRIRITHIESNYQGWLRRA